MIRHAPELFDLLQHGEILYAPALPFKGKGFYADMALITTEGSTKIIAEGADLSNGEETFYLNLDEFDGDKYWPDKQGVSAWPPRQDEGKQWTAVDLALDIKKSGLETVLASDRKVRFYRNDNASQIGPRGLLQSAVAVKLLGKQGQLFIYATPEFPCSLKVVMEPFRIAAILVGLEEFYPGRT